MSVSANYEKMYDVNPELTTCATNVFSYAKDSLLPISLAHYSHEHILSTFTSTARNNTWCSMFIYLSGKFSFLINEHMYTPSFGDIFIMRERENYTSVFPGISYIDYYQLYLPPEFFKKAASADILTPLFYDRRLFEKNLITPDKATFNHILENLHCIEEISNAKSKYADILIYSHFIQIAEAINSAFTSSALTANSKIPPKLSEAIEYIHNHFTTINGVNEVSRACNISDTYLARIFKEHIMCTPNEYISNLRISHAKHLLSNGESITDTCYKSGFNNYTYFITKFKQLSGFTPSEFRKHNI